jgi:hypothetical protein
MSVWSREETSDVGDHDVGRHGREPERIGTVRLTNKDTTQGILEAAKRHRLIAHRFYASDDGSRLLVLDEWPDRQSFKSFFGEQESQIRPIFEAGGVTSEPQPRFWDELETRDRFGWGA